MPKNKLHKSFKVGFSGLREITLSERNFKIHMVFAALVIFFALYLKVEKSELIFLIVVCGLVLISAVLNTVFELFLDVFHPPSGRNRVCDLAAKIIKDMLAGAVLISVIIAVIVGLLIFIPHLLHWKLGS